MCQTIFWFFGGRKKHPEKKQKIFWFLSRIFEPDFEPDFETRKNVTKNVQALKQTEKKKIEKKSEEKTEKSETKKSENFRRPPAL